MDQPSLSGLLKAADLPKIKGGPPPFAGMSEFTALDQPLIQDFLDHDRMGAALSAELRNQMAQFMGASEKENFTPPVPGLTPYAPGNATHVSSLVPALTALAHFIIEELENQLGDLVRINRSRREAIAQYLDRLAGHLPGPGGAVGGTDTLGSLGRWLSSARTPAQNAAFQTFFEEIALITLGRAILLKAWSDRGIRAWCEADLGKVNTLNEALRPKIPLDREGWQITSQNIYTWYNPSPRIQREIWTTLENLRITDEGPSFLMSLLRPARQAKPPVRESEGYDPRFFDAIWKTLPRLGFPLQNLDAGPLKRSRVFFTPTLRDGAAVRTGPVTAHWIALESSPFQLMMAELVQLWWGPAAPPLWAIGTGLDVHRGEQLALALGSPKPSVLSRITEMEACDLAVVLEEKIIRGQGRTSEALRFREQADAIPALKKLRSASTSLGDIQAGIALSKLRPGGLLLWAREEALAAKDGNEMLGSLLERAKIVCEWDFSELEHSLPGAIPLFPKHLYLLAREPRLQERLGHRPLKVSVKGQIRSHVELPLMLEDALMALQNPPSPRGHWEVRPHKSPTTQKDWAERWPDPACKNADRLLDRLRAVSLPLANFGNVKNTPAGDPAREGAWSLDPSLKGFWIRAEARALIAQPLPRLGREAKGSGFVVLVADESWVAPLIAYLQSEPVRVWLDHHAERRADRWMLDEQTARCLPIPRSLLKALGAQSSDQPDATDFALPLPGE
ncbi:MAG: hypothetical protein ACXVBW_09095, partial [Bdellovibrionota bacterium]